jgi:hypothetical protein
MSGPSIPVPQNCNVIAMKGRTPIIKPERKTTIGNVAVNLGMI